MADRSLLFGDRDLAWQRLYRVLEAAKNGDRTELKLKSVRLHPPNLNGMALIGFNLFK